MEWFFQEFIPIALLAIGILSLLLLIAIANSIGKLLKYLGEEGDGIPLMRESGELRGPDYVDQAVLRGRGEPHSDGVTHRSTRNWDGFSSPNE